MAPSSAECRIGCRVLSDPAPHRFSRFAAAAVALIAASCGGPPDGALLEVHVTADPAIEEDLREYRVYRVGIQGAGLDVLREVERRGDAPDVFVVRSPVPEGSPEDAPTVTVQVRALRFTTDGSEEIIGCGQDHDRSIVDGAVTIVDVTLAPGDCS